MLRNYFKTAFKVLLRRKFFTFISLFGISFTLMVLMVVVAMMDHVFGVHPPEVNDRRMLNVVYLKMKGPNATSTGRPGFGFLERTARDLPGAERVSFVSGTQTVTSYQDGRKIKLESRRTDGEFWNIIRMDFVEGGPFTADDDRSARFVTVLTESARDRLFGDGPAVGRRFEADGQRFEVVGVVRDVAQTRFRSYAEMYVPNGTSRTDAYRREFSGGYIGLVLARSEADLPSIRDEFAARVKRLESPDPKEFTEMFSYAEPLFAATARLMIGDERSEADNAALLGGGIALAGLLFMLLPTLNLVNVNVSRILERASEIGVRRAFGASRRTLVAQFLVENVVLTLIGAVVGLALAAAVLAAVNSSGLVPHARFGLNLRVFAWAGALALFFGLLSGVYPAFKMSRLHPVTALRGGSR